jgi:hypothetical protein
LFLILLVAAPFVVAVGAVGAMSAFATPDVDRSAYVRANGELVKRLPRFPGAKRGDTRRDRRTS